MEQCLYKRPLRRKQVAGFALVELQHPMPDLQSCLMLTKLNMIIWINQSIEFKIFE